MITIKKLFPSPVLDTILDDWDMCKAEIKKCIDNGKEMEMPPTAKYTNVSKCICKDILNDCPTTRSKVEYLLNHYANEVGIKPLEITDSWINQYQYREFLPPHHHLPQHITGTIFVDIPADGGEFFFTRSFNDTDHIFLTGGYTNMNPLNEPAHLIKPTEGQLIIFPSYLYHASSPVLTKDFVRHTLAFNAKISSKK